MIPLLVSVVGFTVAGVCIWLFVKSGGAAWKRKLREELKKDKETFGSDEHVG